MLLGTNKNDKSLGTEYNVEFIERQEKVANGEVKQERSTTFSGTLVNIDNVYFWFMIDDCVACIRQDRIIWMLPLPERMRK